MKKLNCWEFMKCGREPGGANVDEMGICPATQCKSLDGAHGGKNAGRACWVVAGSMCKGNIQGTFAIKYLDCSRCEFYRYVREEESWRFANVGELLMRMNKDEE
ncbi:MAG: hypothetical protein KAR83_00750 [Thermodesulfovibrionales bacterium]|nr:hypothetical protein [Thermodesulfovibrionales bacterium]